MSGNNILVDTNIILYLLGGDKTIIPLLQDKKLFISFITELELLSFKRLSEKEEKIIKNFLTECTIFDINPKIKEFAISLRKKYSFKIPDTIIIATAMYLDLSLISADLEFKKVKEVDLVMYKR